MRRILFFSLFFVALILFSSVLVQASIQTCKSSYKTTESISVKSTSQLCNNVDAGATIKLYIVEDKDASSLNVIKEQDVSNSVFSCTNVLDNPPAGEYDVFVDCVEDGKYQVLEPFYSFTVTVIAGTASASRGVQDIGNHSWSYDSEEPNLLNEMIQLSLQGTSEDIELKNITIKSSGSGDDTTADRIEVYVDNNNNGELNAGDEKIGEAQPAYLVNDGATTIDLDYMLPKDNPINVLIVYTMKETTSEGEFSLTVQSISGIGESSQKEIVFSGLPLGSGVKKVLPQKTCLGNLIFKLEPNPVSKGDKVTANISSMAGCANKTIVLRENPCGSSLQEQINSCLIKENEQGCSIQFTSSVSKTYYACIDKNGDGDMVDVGEYSLLDLVVSKPTPTTPEIKVMENLTGFNETLINKTEEQEKTTITGGVIAELKEKISSAGSLFMLLEITLLLILFVLVMIMFRLKPRVEGSRRINRNKSNKNNKPKAKEEEKEENKEE